MKRSSAQSILKEARQMKNQLESEEITQKVKLRKGN